MVVSDNKNDKKWSLTKKMLRIPHINDPKLARCCIYNQYDNSINNMSCHVNLHINILSNVIGYHQHKNRILKLQAFKTGSFNQLCTMHNAHKLSFTFPRVTSQNN